MKQKIGNVLNQQKEMRGWLVGQFFPDGSPFQDKNIEIYLKTLKKNEFVDKLHYHPKGKEYFVVLNGNLKMQIGDEIVNIKKGEYLSVPNKTPDKILDFEDETAILGVRYPSIPNNKVIIEES